MANNTGGGLANQDILKALNWLKDKFGEYLPTNGKAVSATNADYANSAGSANSVAWNNITGKPAIPANPNAYLTGSWRSGNNFWRRWSDGFIEQGGAAWLNGQNNAISGVSGGTVSLHTSFSSANYCIVAVPNYRGTPVNTGWFQIYSRAANSFTGGLVLYENGLNWEHAQNIIWYACGY